MKRGVLLCPPDHFDVLTADNPHMQGSGGRTHEVNPAVAATQWQALCEAYRSIGVDIHLLSPTSGLSDQVFTANPAFVHGDGFIPSRMRFSSRQPEVAAMSDWLIQEGYERLRPRPGFLEGGGDLIVAGDTLLMGHGIRSDRLAGTSAADALGLDPLPLLLTDDRFFHLDTCLCLLGDDTVLLYSGAFDSASLHAIRERFGRIIEVDGQEAMRFACNAHCPDGRHILIDAACQRTMARLQTEGFEPVPLDTSEFRKSGGSVYCMKQALS